MNSPNAIAKLPTSKRTSYQFPIYKWIGWLAVVGFAIGLTAMFFIAGMFGIPAPLAWSFLVILFTAGALLLDHPKLLLVTMMFYFMLMPANRLLGLLGLPLPGFIDEIFFLPFIAVIVMNWIQRRQLKEATLFPLVFCLIAGLSWVANDRPSPFTAVQVTLIMLKSYIIWYYCRLTSTFESERQLARWVWIYILYATIQYFYNVLWQQGPLPRFHPDHSGGMLGPEGFGNAHLVGYISVFAIYLMAGWWVSAGARVGGWKRLGAFLCLFIIVLDFIFMTDTKHALILAPIAAMPILLHPKFSTRLRMGLLTAGAIIVFLATIYLRMFVGEGQIIRTMQRAQDTPKGEMFYAVTVDFPHLVPYPLLGAGPGRFASSQAVAAMAPLARRYIIPEMMALHRSTLSKGILGSQSGGSLLGTPVSDFFTLMGEFGWLGALAYYSFWTWVAVRLFRKSVQLPLDNPQAGLLLALCSCIVFYAITTTLASTSTIPVVAFPLWMLVGRVWDMRRPPAAPEEAAA